jgi:hypothetical protein
MKKLLYILLLLPTLLNGQVITIDRIDTTYIYNDTQLGIINLSSSHRYNYYPTASNVTLTGSFNPDSLLTISKTFYDRDGDLEGNSIYTFQYAFDTTGTVSTLLVNDSLTVPDSLSGYWIVQSSLPKAPTGQGIIDKAALQAYRSPDPPGTADLWTITTR